MEFIIHERFIYKSVNQQNSGTHQAQKHFPHSWFEHPPGEAKYQDGPRSASQASNILTRRKLA